MSSMRRTDIAIVGMACAFPKAANLRAYWRNLVDGVDAVTEIPPHRWPGRRNTTLAPGHESRLPSARGGFLPPGLWFDPLRYGIVPNAVRYGEPDPYFILSLTDDALRDAGIAADSPTRARTDVIIGRGGYVNYRSVELALRAEMIDLLLDQAAASGGIDPSRRDAFEKHLRAALPSSQSDSLATTIPNIVASQTANRLNLRGRACVVDAACASSLIAVEDAMRRLREGLSDAAVAGGVFFCNCPTFHVGFSQLGAVSPTGWVRPFDRRADGLVVGEGGGVVVLKRLDDAIRDHDRIYAVIRGVGVASDGREVDVLAPSKRGQIAALEAAYEDAGVDRDTVTLLEAHGTATVIGDRTELATIRAFYGETSAVPWGRCLGSVKSMIGHLMPAAGIASLIKVALALSHKVIPPSLHCEQPLEELEGVPFHVATATRAWVRDPALGPRRAGINSFGLGGINAHLVLEEALPRPARGRKKRGPLPREIEPGLAWPTELLAFSGATRADVVARLARLESFLDRDESGASLADVACAASRELESSHPCRLALVARDVAELRDLIRTSVEFLSAGGPPPAFEERIAYSDAADRPCGKVACIFPGMAFPGLTRKRADHILDLAAHFPEIRAVLDHVDSRDRNPGDPVPLSAIYSPPASLPEDFKRRQHSRLELPISVGPLPDYTRPEERLLVSQGMMIANWLGWVMLRVLDVPVDMMMGQSLGELNALCAAGTMDFDEMVQGFWMGMDVDPQIARDEKMAFAAVPAERLAPIVAERSDVHLAIHAAPESIIFGGKCDAVDAIVEQLRAEGIFVVVVALAPMHTPCMSHLRIGARDALLDADVRSFRPPRIPTYSCSTTALYPSDKEGIVDHVLANIDQPAYIWQTARRLYDDGARIFLQASGGNVALQIKGMIPQDDVICAALDLDTRDVVTQLNHFCAILLTSGIPFRHEALFQHRHVRSISFDAPQPAEAPPLTAIPYRLDWSPQPGVSTADRSEDVAKEAAGPTAASEIVLHAKPASAAADPADAPSLELDIDLPFLGPIEHYVPGEELDYRITLTLDEDLFLHHHHFIDAADIKPLSSLDCTVPMTMSMELLAQAAAALAPGLGLIGFENIRASRWISFVDQETLDLRVEARRQSDDPQTGVRRVRATVYLKDGAAASATLLFASEYRHDLATPVPESPDDPPWPITVRESYASHRLFHGPMFQCISALHGFGNPTFSAELEVLPTGGLFASRPEPTLLTDPVVMDGVGQLVGLWWGLHDEDVLPTGVERIEIRRPTPPVGTRVRMRGEMVEFDPDIRRVRVNMDVEDGEGGLWMRIVGWTDFVFQAVPGYTEFIRLPAENFVSREIVLPDEPPGTVCAIAELSQFRYNHPDRLVRLVLHVDEEPEYRAIADDRRRRDFIVSRFALKDAIRLWWLRRGAEPIHPATILIRHDALGRPYVSQDGEPALPYISLAHIGATAVAVASDEEAGIDLERNARREEGFLESIASADERAVLESLAAIAPDDAWETRLWCAKEAAAKAIGTGLQGRPRDFALIEGGADGEMLIEHRPTGEQLPVVTFPFEAHLIAFTRRGPEAAPLDAGDQVR